MIMSARFIAWLGLLIASCITGLSYALIATTFDASSEWRVFLFSGLGALSLLLVFLMPRFKGWRLPVFGIWIPALLLRSVLLPSAPSDDVNRYLWEGRLVADGVSPYAQAADDVSLVEYRDDVWQAMNHKDKPTAYPPLAEIGFAGVATLVYHPLAFKVIFVAADLLTLAAILSLLRRRGLSQAFAGLYAFSPVTLISFAGEAHFDSWMLAALIWALWAVEVGRRKWAVLLVSVATGVKWVTLPLLPFFAVGGGAVSPELAGLSGVRGERRYLNILYLFIAGVSLLVPALFFWSSLPALFEGLFKFGGTRSFNGPIYETLLLGLGLPRVACTVIVAGLFGVVLLWRWSVRRTCSLDAHCRWMLGSLIVLSPTVHFWYIAWILPFVCLRPSMPWLVLSVTSGAYFYVWINEFWGLTIGQLLIFWVPFFIALLYELWSTRGRIVFPLTRDSSEAVSISIVIPTLNVAKHLEGALGSIARQTCQPIEVICVDAGSVDTTLEIARRSDLPLRVIQGPKGRGQQIAVGIEVARGTWVCVLHADALLPVTALDNLTLSVQSDPAILGGAFGQRFEESQAELLPIELLNDLRGIFTRTAFGDQVQFFHRESALRYEFMPKQALMEDVESSWRLREAGGFLFLNQPCEACHRSWKASEWLTRFRLVMSLVSRYRFARLRSREEAQALCDALYEEYYTNGK